MLAAGLGLLGPAATGSATLTVCPRGCQYTTIKAALAVAHNGDTISIGAGTYAGGFTVRASVSLLGAGRRATTIERGGGSVVTIDRGAGVLIGGVTIRDGRALLRGGGIDNEGNLVLMNSVVANNRAGTSSYQYPGAGGGIYNNGGHLTLVRTRVQGNGASEGGGIDSVGGGTLVLRGSAITDNLAHFEDEAPGGASGGGIDSVGRLILLNTIVDSNRTRVPYFAQNASAGGILSLGVATMINSRVTRNGVGGQQEGDGGGITSGGTMTLRRTLVAENTIDVGINAFGGGIESFGRLTLIQSRVIANSAAGGLAEGGGIWNGGRLSIYDSPVSKNVAGASDAAVAFGGGIDNLADVRLIRSPITFNTARAQSGGGHGGGVFNERWSGARIQRRIASPVFRNAPDNCEDGLGGGVYRRC
jgi:hypothetical protein